MYMGSVLFIFLNHGIELVSRIVEAAPTCGLLGTDVGQRPDGAAARRGEILLLVKNPVSASVRPRRGAVAGGHGIGTGLPGG